MSVQIYMEVHNTATTMEYGVPPDGRVYCTHIEAITVTSTGSIQELIFPDAQANPFANHNYLTPQLYDENQTGARLVKFWVWVYGPNNYLVARYSNDAPFDKETPIDEA